MFFGLVRLQESIDVLDRGINIGLRSTDGNLILKIRVIGRRWSSRTCLLGTELDQNRARV